MMARNSSPFSVQSTNIVPGTPSLARTSKMLDDGDELVGDTVPCSPAGLLQYQGSNVTQPTQVLSRPSLQASSPPPVVEVPASSPFQQPPKRPFANRLAPMGTVFRPPNRPQTQSTIPKKRPSPGPIYISSDDEEGLTPPRGDIRPTTFKTQVAQFTYDPEADKKRQRKEKMRQVFDVFGNTFSYTFVMETLEGFDDNVEETIEWLENHGLNSKPKPKPGGRRLVSKASLQSKDSSSRATPHVLSSSPAPSPSPPKPVKRRLVQGLKKRKSPQPRDSGAKAPSSDDPLVISLVDNDKEDAYKAERSPTPAEDEDDRVLNSINTSTLQELAAMTGLKEDMLKPIIEKRPFETLSQAKKVSVSKKPGARKSARVSVGETAVDAITMFLNAVSGLDEVVAKCEKKGSTVKTIIDTWDLDNFGQTKLSRLGTPSGSYPPTPTSLTSGPLVRPLVPTQPKAMDGHCVMKPFQVFGLNWMTLLYNYGIGCILADEMGLGKTCQVISLMCHLVEEYENDKCEERPWPNLIVVPPSTYNNWLAEFERFAPDINVIGYRGSQAERREIAAEIYENADDCHVVLATYSQINSEDDIEGMQRLDLNAAIYDEGHKMKNPQTKLYKDLRRIPASWKMLLTGTPVQNNLLEMTSLLSFINPSMFDGYMEQIQYIFSQKVTIRDVTNGAFLYSERVSRARTILEPFILQRRKDQVLDDMPKKIRTVVSCEMTEGQEPVYGEYEKIFRMEPSQRAARATGRANDQNNVWIQLRKASLHPMMFRRYFNNKKVEKMAQILMDRVSQDELRQPDIKHLIGELQGSSDFELHLWCRDYPRLLGQFDIPPEAMLDSGKVKKLLELIAQYQENGDRVLVFSKFARMLELLREVLAHNDVEHRVLKGETSVNERQGLIDEFNGDPSIPVFLLTTGAGGTGINLTAANKVIIFDQSDNPQDDIQAENRAHRLGQKREVEIIRLISKDTIEELINKACEKKIELANKVTGAFDETTPAQAEKNMEQEVRKMMEQKMTPP